MDWIRDHHNEITWFVIGWLCYAGLDALARGDYVWALVDFGLAYGNYRLN